MNADKRHEIFTRLRAENPNPTTELNYNSPFELLIAVLLSAQATDVGVNKATGPLFAAANTPEAIYKLGIDGLKEYIKTIGLFNTKAVNAHKTCKILMDELQQPGTGRPRRTGGATRCGPQDRERGTQYRLRPPHHCGRYPHLPRVQQDQNSAREKCP